MQAVQLMLLLPMLLPLIGKVLLMIPIVPNKAIPLINMAISTAGKYWMLTFGTALGTVPGGDVGVVGNGVLMAGIFGSLGAFGLSMLSGVVDQTMAHFFYEGRRATAKLAGKTSWWEGGKASVFGKQ